MPVYQNPELVELLNRAMVLICSKQGRPTSGVTLTSNTIAQMILAASHHELPPERIYIAPHGPTFSVQYPDDQDAVPGLDGVSYSPLV